MQSKERRKRLLDAVKELTDVVTKIDEEMESVKHDANKQAWRDLVPRSKPYQYIGHTKGANSKNIVAMYIDEKGNWYQISINTGKI